jgi:hypothetical protein
MPSWAFATEVSGNAKPKAANAANANTILRIFFSKIPMTITGSCNNTLGAKEFRPLLTNSGCGVTTFHVTSDLSSKAVINRWRMLVNCAGDQRGRAFGLSPPNSNPAGNGGVF